MFRKMLVPLDASELSEVTFNYALELAGRFEGLEVVLLHICSDKNTVAMHRDYIEHSAEKVRVEAQKSSGRSDIKVRGELLTGTPADEILRFADENGIDLILMATHGALGLEPLGYGQRSL